MKYKVIDLTSKDDERGSLIEIFREPVLGNSFKGQVFLATAKPGKIRGLHYHKRKTEWYCLLKGNARLTLINNKTKEETVYNMSGKNPQVVQIPPHHFHFIENVGNSEMQLLVYVDEVFNPKSQDTFFEDLRSI